MSATLGACLISHNIPYEGMAKDIIERRIAGQSWKQIGEDLNIGSPGKARSMFTKLTGITDYKIKGNDLLKLAQGDVNSNVGSAVKKAVTSSDPPDLGGITVTGAENIAKIENALDPVQAITDYQKKVWLNNLKNAPTTTDLTPFQNSILGKLKAGKALTDKQVDAFSVDEIISMYQKTGMAIPDTLKPYLPKSFGVDLDPKVVKAWQAQADKYLDLAIQKYSANTWVPIKAAIKKTDWSDIDSIDKLFTTIQKRVIGLEGSSEFKKPDNLKIWLNQKNVAHKVKPAATKAEIPDVTSSKLKPVKQPDVSDVTESVQGLIKANHAAGKGYAQIRSDLLKQGIDVNIDQIDRVVARHLLQKNNNDVWKALKQKPDSLALQKEISDVIFDAIQKGMTKKQIHDAMGVPNTLIDDVVKANGNWTKPFGQKLPDDKGHLDDPNELPEYQMHVSSAKPPSHMELGSVDSGLGKGKGEVAQEIFPRATNEKLAAMRRRRWETQTAASRDTAERGIRSYTGSSYIKINGDLRNGRTNVTAKNMDKGMYEVDENLSVTRGMGIEGFGMGHMTEKQILDLVGKVVSDKGFLSTSTRPVFGGTVRLNIEVPKGARGHWAKPISMHSSEDEFIMARGTRLMILGIEKQTTGSVYGGNRYLVRARVIT